MKNEKENCGNVCTHSHKKVVHHVLIAILILLFLSAIICSFAKHHRYEAYSHKGVVTDTSCMTKGVMTHESMAGYMQNYDKADYYNGQMYQSQKNIKATYQNKSLVSEVQIELFKEILKAELEERLGEEYQEKATLLIDALLEVQEVEVEQKEAALKMKEVLETTP